MKSQKRTSSLRGHYAEKQLACKDRIIAWSHRSRFALGRKLVQPFGGKRLLDYGCGDGTFLEQVADIFPYAIGADVSAEQNATCRQRLGHLPGLSFTLTSELQNEAYCGKFDIIMCMEVLEHCPQDILELVLLDFKRLLAPNGKIIISVPIEIGPALLAKQILRRIAGMRRLGDYQYLQTYSWGDLFRSVFAGERTVLKRTEYRDSSGRSCTHFGFNWRALRFRLHQDFEIVQDLFTPLGWTRGLFSSQAWFIGQPRNKEV